MNILKINLTTIVLCLGLAGYLSATDGLYAKTPSVEQETQKMEVTIPVEYNEQLRDWNCSSPYYVSTIATSISTLTHEIVKEIFPEQPGFFMRLIRVAVEVVRMNAVVNYTSSYFKPAMSQFPVLDRLIMLQHFRYRKLDWPLYGLASSGSISISSGGKTYSDELWNYSMIFCGIYAILYNYLFRGKNATKLPYWGSISYMPCFRICSSSKTDKKLEKEKEKEKKTVWRECYSLDNYIGYGDRTFLIGVSLYKYPKQDERWAGSVFVSTDRLLSVKGRHTVDIEAGTVWNEKKDIEWLAGVKGRFRLREYCSLYIAGSYKTPYCKEGITASGDGWTLSGGITLHI